MKRVLAVAAALALVAPGPLTVSAFAQTVFRGLPAAPEGPAGAVIAAPGLESETAPVAPAGLDAPLSLGPVEGLTLPAGSIGYDTPALRDAALSGRKVSLRPMTIQDVERALELGGHVRTRAEVSKLRARDREARRVIKGMARASDESASQDVSALLENARPRSALELKNGDSVELGSPVSQIVTPKLAPAGKSPQVAVARPLNSQHEKRSIAPALGAGVIAFLVGLVLIQIGVEFLGQSMPQLVRTEFGAFKFYAVLTLFSSVARVFGSAIGGALPDQFGLKATYIGANAAKVVSIGSMVALLVTHHMTVPLLMGFYALNGLFTGVAMTAESSLPPRLVGQDQSKLDKFNGISQIVLELVGIGAPIVAGGLISATGTFNYALAVYPVAILAAVLVFAKFLKISKDLDVSELHKAELQEQPQAKKGFWQALKEAFVGVFKRIGEGAKIAWVTKPLRTAIGGYVAFLMLNYVLYAMIAPAYGLYAALGNPSAAAAIQSILVGAYSAGSLVATMYMLWAAGRIEKAQKEGRIDEAEAKARARKSTLMWMVLGTTSLAAFIPLIWADPVLAYVSIFIFGAGSVVPYLKLKGLVQSLAPKVGVEKVMGFMQAVSILVATAGIWGLGVLFDALPGQIGFMWLAGIMIPLAAVFIGLTLAVRKHTKPS